MDMMLYRRVIGFGLAAGTILWVISMGLGFVEEGYLYQNWRGLSELVWLGIGVWFLITFYKHVVLWSWSGLISYFMQANFVMVFFWWLWMLLMVTLLGEAPVTLEAVTGIEVSNGGLEGGWLSVWLRLWSGIAEAMRLLFVGILPAVLYKGYQTKVKK